MFNSLRFRLFLSHLVVALTTLVLVSAALLLALREQAIVNLETYNQLHRAVASLIAVGEPPPVPAGASPDELRRLAAQAAQQAGRRVVIVDPAGGVLADSHPDQPRLVRFRRAGPASAEFRQGLHDYALDERRRLWLAVQRPMPGDGPQYFLLERRPTVLRFIRENLSWPLAQAGLIAGLLSTLLAILIARSVAGPLRHVAAGARAVARGQGSDDPVPTVPVSGPSEVRSVAQSFNEMAKQVRAAQAAQRDFVANVSHDLKTPLTSIQGFAQAILDGAADTPDQLRRSASIIFDEAERMRRLVDGLLDLARLDARLSTLSRVSTDVSALLTSASEKLGRRAAEKGLSLQTHIQALPPIPGDPDRLAQVFDNLLDNALKYTPAGGSILLNAAQVGGAIEVVVADTGAGIPPEDLPRIFERFYQVDKSRVGASEARGAGLGLAITKEIVEAHGGQVRAESAAGRGAKFTVRLPLPRPDDTTVARRRRPGR